MELEETAVVLTPCESEYIALSYASQKTLFFLTFLRTKVSTDVEVIIEESIDITEQMTTDIKCTKWKPQYYIDVGIFFVCLCSQLLLLTASLAYIALS